MASVHELVALFNEGKLGELFRERFKGTLGHLCANKDSDFLVEFPTDADVPLIGDIADAVSRFYLSRGYELRDPGLHEARKRFEAVVAAGGDNSRRYVRVTTTRID